MVARIPSLSLPSVKPATGIRLFWSVMSSLFRASIPPVKRISIGFRATPVAGSGTVFFDHLVDGHTRGDHGVDVRLGVDVEVQDGAAFLLLGPLNRCLDVVVLADGAPGDPVGSGELLVVGPRYGRLRVAAVVEEMLPPAEPAPGTLVYKRGFFFFPPIP